MTNSEAIEVLKSNYPDRCYESLREAIDVAINALSAQPKKKLLFSDRQEIVKEYKKWCLINNVDGCEASFLAYLCITGYIDG